jgi:hypothetical protein
MKKLLPPGSLLLAGLPATGKSSFGNWLEQNKGYFHLDFDEEDIIQQRGFGHAQDRLWHHEDATPLWDGIVARHQPIVLTWGFAPQFLPLVKQLLTWGFVPAWFAASRSAARRAVIKRGGMDVKYFDRYMELLQPIEAEVEVLFGRNVLQTLRDDGSRLSFESIYEHVSPWLV